MSFTINENLYTSTFEKTKKGFQHSKGNHLKLFPFGSDMKHYSVSTNELKAFHGTAGKFCRNCLHLAEPPLIPNSLLTKSIVSEVDSEHKATLIRIIEELLLDEDKNLILFNYQILPYLTAKNKNPKLDSLEEFISALLVDQEIKKILSENFTLIESTNVFYRLVLDYFKSVVIKNDSFEEDNSYYAGEIVVEIRRLFKTDLKSLIINKPMFTTNIASLIKFYYFIYIKRLSSSITPLFDDQKGVSPFFFTLEWEKVSKSRIAVENGWKRLENLVDPIFAHANCLELINTINFPQKDGLPDKLIYSDIFDMITGISEEAEKDFTIAIQTLIKRYQTAINGVNWSEFEQNYLAPDGNNYKQFHSLSLIYKLFSMIRYQFETVPTRRPPYTSFSRWFKEFVKFNYVKSRGTLGATLKIDKELLLLFTELSIMSNPGEKLLISHLWLELEKRDILFDNTSKKEIVLFFEKINILEKKSDSGDAQYVKRLYK